MTHQDWHLFGRYDIGGHGENYRAAAGKAVQSFSSYHSELERFSKLFCLVKQAHVTFLPCGILIMQRVTNNLLLFFLYSYVIKM